MGGSNRAVDAAGSPLALVALGVVMALVAGACSVSGLNFVQDERVSISAPRDREKVEVPVTIRWEVRDFDGTFAVFVDRAPVPPGKALAWLAEDDELCSAQPGCPTVQWFHDRYVFPTAETTLTLEQLPELRADEGRIFHEATVVLIGRDGRRVGESAFTVQFELAGEDR